MPTTGDDAIDSAFSSAAADPTHPATGDESIDAAFAPSAGVPLSGKEVMGQVIRAEASKIPAGLKSVYDITLGGKSAAEADAAYKKATTPNDPTAQAMAGRLGQVMGSPYNPLTWPGRAFDAAGNLINAAADPANAMGSNPALAAKTGLPQYQPSTLPTTGGPTALGPVLSGVAQGAAGLAPLAKGAMTPRPTLGPFENSPQSMGAAKAVDPRLAAAAPELQQAVRQAAQDTGGAVNQTAYENHLDADQHGVQLMEGQATRDENQFSAEQNSVHPDIKARISKQDVQMTDALDNIRREAAPGAVQNNPIENGQTAVDKLKAYDEPVVADIDKKYAAARAASATGDLQMDGSSFVSDANAALKPQSKFRFLPSTAKGILDDVAGANGKMTLDDYQAYDTQLGNEIAKAKAAQDGNAAFAIGKVKEALNQVKPVDAETSQAKTLFDTARSAAKARFDELDDDPAYQAAVSDVSLSGVKRGQPSALADKFLDKYALQAPKANLDRLMGKLDEEGQQAVTSHALSTIRDKAISPNGQVSPHGYNGAIEKYGPKLDSLMAPETRESLESLGRVITSAKVPPPGHSVNYTKSGVVVNAAKGVGSELMGAAVNAKTLGMGMPVIKGMAENAFAKRSLAPGAGLSKLQTTPPP
jgi:hypothetical protein